MYTLTTQTVQKSSTTTNLVESSFSASNIFLQKKSQDKADILAKIIQPHARRIQKSSGTKILPLPMQPKQATPPKIQRFGFGIGDELNKYANHVPGWKLFTVIIGYNPLTSAKIPRTAKNFVQGVLGLAPGGNQLYSKLDEMGLIDKAFIQVSKMVNKLNITLSLLERLLSEAWDELSILSGNALEVLKNKFKPLFNRIVTTAIEAGGRLLDMVKEKLVVEASNFLKTVPGFTLLTLTLKKNPITQMEVTPDAVAYVGGMMEFVPGGREKFEDLKQSGRLQKAFHWLDKRVKKLGIKVSHIVQLFKKAWNSLTIKDLVIPVLAFKKLSGIFGSTIGRIAGFAKDVLFKILEFTFIGLLGPTANRIIEILKKSKKTFNIIVANPLRFAGYLLSAVKKGFNKFNKNILVHLKIGLAEWVMGGLQKAGVVIPEKWDLKGVIGLALQIFGITYAKMRLKLVKIFGEKNVSRLEKVFETVRILVTEGPGALWNKLVETIGNLKDKVVGAIREWVVTKIIKSAILKIVSMLNPVGAVVQAVLAIYNTLMFFVERINQILDLVTSVVNSIALIAVGKISAAAHFVEQSMARTIPVIISFLARLIELGGISNAIQNILKKFHKSVDKALDKAFGWLVEKAKVFLAKGKATLSKIMDWWRIRKSFTGGDGKEHTLFFEGNATGSKLMIASKKTTFKGFIADLPLGNNSDMKKAKENAGAIARQIDEIKGRSIPKGTKEEEKAVKQAKADEISEKLEELRIITAPFFGNIRPSSEPAYTPGTPFALGTSIQNLTIIPPPINGSGTVPTKASHEVYDKLDNRRQGEKGASYYIRGHLLNHNLHGHGDWYNMTPLTREGNSKHEKEVESKVKTAVDSGATVNYEVIPEYGKQPDKDKLISDIMENDGELSQEATTKKQIVALEDHVPLYLKCFATSVEESKTKWSLGGVVKVMNPVDRTYEAYQLGSKPAPLIVKINTCPKDHYRHLPGIGDGLAARIFAHRKSLQESGEVKVFYKLEDLKEVSGIGTATLDKIKEKGNYDLAI